MVDAGPLTILSVLVNWILQKLRQLQVDSVHQPYNHVRRKIYRTEHIGERTLKTDHGPTPRRTSDVRRETLGLGDGPGLSRIGEPTKHAR